MPRVLLTALVALGAAGARQAAPQEPAFDLKAHYAKRDTMIPMRDGVKLFTIVYAPRDTTRAYPILLVRTPYSIPPYEPDSFRTRLGPSREFDRDGYIFVFQDVRGKFRSEGEFEVMRPFRPTKRTPKDVDESSDTYDTIDWLLKNIP
ncbi:MAG: CocE/NonD family hydrolase, partial [Candidatus Rokuibacteriota bacterium]